MRQYPSVRQPRGRRLRRAMLITSSHSPRESAVDIVHLINNRNQNVALLALAVCDRNREMTAGAGMADIGSN
jgi:hypothetical protein